MMGDNGPLNYYPGTHGPDGWTVWYAGHPILLVVTGAVLVGLTAIYACATIAFGFRFSNLTQSRHIDARPLRLFAPPGLSVEEPVLVDLDRAGAVHRLVRRCGAGDDHAARAASAASITGAPRPRNGICRLTRTIRHIPPGWTATAWCRARSTGCWGASARVSRTKRHSRALHCHRRFLTEAPAGWRDCRRCCIGIAAR